MTPQAALTAWLAAAPTEPTPESLLRYANAHHALLEAIGHAHVWNLAGCAVPSDLESQLRASIELMRERKKHLGALADEDDAYCSSGGCWCQHASERDEALRVVEREQRDGGLVMRLVGKAEP